MSKKKLRVEESHDGGKTWNKRDGVFDLEDEQLLSQKLHEAAGDPLEPLFALYPLTLTRKTKPKPRTRL